MASTDRHDGSSDSKSDFDPLNIDPKDDEGWEDLEPDQEEQLRFKSLFDDDTFTSLLAVFEHDRTKHGFDLAAIRQRLNLDFLGCVKLVNYVRSATKSGNLNLDLSSTDRFLDEKYLLPVLEDDAVLFSLGDLDDPASDGTGKHDLVPTSDGTSRTRELEDELRQARDMIAELRLMSQRALDDASSDASASMTTQTNNKEKAVADRNENDQQYFKSYAYNDIHEVMLKDTVRTDAYRDFIYENKDLFKDRIVLDVGCGTGILSMMCARAGAKKVFAVDNSDIINKARANVFENGLQGIVTCLHGKIEDISLPVDKVDIIVSEWMGYALLYESMLDSVISARDRYLVPGGLMVPSHATLFIAPLSVQDIVADRIDFWQDVYGFKMRAMLEGVYEEILLRNLDQGDLAGSPSAFVQLALHKTTIQDTTFARKSFRCKLDYEVDSLDGFAIWFDMFFARASNAFVPAEMQAQDYEDGIAFTTGPGKKQTHWQQVVLLIDHANSQRKAGKLLAGTEIVGTIGYERRNENNRLLDIKLEWKGRGDEKMAQQKWELI